MKRLDLEDENGDVVGHLYNDGAMPSRESMTKYQNAVIYVDGKSLKKIGRALNGVKQ